MNKKKFTRVARNVIDLEIKGLQKLKNSIDNSTFFNPQISPATNLFLKENFRWETRSI